MTKRFYLLISLIYCLAISSQTQHFYTSDKLSSSQITTISQDQTGYIWIGTEYGINKYDGYRFTTYLHQQDNANSIQSNNIAKTFVDRQGNLWVGSGMGLTLYNAANDEFERIALPSTAAPRVNDIIQSDDHHLLIQGSETG